MDAVPHKKSAAVLVHGGPMDVSVVTGRASGVIDAFYPGMHGGQAVAEAIFGDLNPGGKLPTTIYRRNYITKVTMADFSMAKPPGRSYKYYNGSDVLFPCFWGLSYSDFSLNWFDTPPREMANTHDNTSVTFSVQVENIGHVFGDEVVMAFWRPLDWVHPVSPSFNVLQRQLFGFQRVSLEPNAKISVLLPLDVDLLSQIDAVGNRVSVPGNYEVILSRGLGPHSELIVPLRLTGTRRV